MAEYFPNEPGSTFTPISRDAIERWVDRQGVALRLLTERELVALAMKHSRGKVDPSAVAAVVREKQSALQNEPKD